MYTIMTLWMLSCSEPWIFNVTEVWNDLDERTFQRAKIRCGQIYPDAPCLTVFYKNAEREYMASCGEKR